MGDFNCPPESIQLAALQENSYPRLSEGVTYPSWRPSQSLDHIFVKGKLMDNSTILQFPSSDHLPVVLEI
ncbi:MAG: hypothetical protein Q4B82_03000 [Alysiella sp.]|uniref:endonuclease/exonuclease/phosphatase family protein n=1 Tax=Alysiella sp. TaxID=1872483 RepID=UPI0026DDB205|nr:endonuclease/exonuclease/phosphatase family protein [Alysiella sp.]MDO4433535.1 hypothetical protein [Alysiella sp.]